MRWLVPIIAVFQVTYRIVFFRVFTDAIFVLYLYCFYFMLLRENKKLLLLSFGRGKQELLYVLCRQ